MFKLVVRSQTQSQSIYYLQKGYLLKKDTRNKKMTTFNMLSCQNVIRSRITILFYAHAAHLNDTIHTVLWVYLPFRKTFEEKDFIENTVTYVPFHISCSSKLHTRLAYQIYLKITLYDICCI